jgi:hypothetical protein
LSHDSRRKYDKLISKQTLMTIQSLKANEIEANWAKMGITNPLHKCEHSIIKKEYYFGSATGYNRCATCGKKFNI